MVHIITLTSTPHMAKIAIERARDLAGMPIRVHLALYDVNSADAHSAGITALTDSFVYAPRADGPFNFSGLNNLLVDKGIEERTIRTSDEGDWLLFLNDDVTARPYYLEAMIEAAGELNAPVVGMKLVYPAGHEDQFTIQHSGVEPGPALGGIHIGLYAPMDSPQFLEPRYKPVWAVTGACLLVRARHFLEAGGFDTGYEHVCQDIDLCLKLRQLAEWRAAAVVQSTYCWHAEGATRGPRGHELSSISNIDGERFVDRWAEFIPESRTAEGRTV